MPGETATNFKGASAPTPAMRQYLEIKEGLKDAILFFRMGDFYEMFYEDAVTASRILGIALTSRDRTRKIPMCGLPYHAAKGYIKKLIAEGFRVAVCDQVEDPSKAKGIVRRAVTRVITPGTVLDDEMLDPTANNFIASISISKKKYGLSYMDISTGEFRVTEFDDAAVLCDELRRIGPLELLVDEGSEDVDFTGDASIKKITPLNNYDFDFSLNLERMRKHFATHSLDGFGFSGLTAGVEAAGALLNYIKETQRSELAHIKKCTPYFTGDFMVVDSTTRRNLEITGNLVSRGSKGTLFEVLDFTSTALGARRLKAWLARPLKDVDAIERRLNAVEELLEETLLSDRLRSGLSDVYDLERLTARVSLGVAAPRDLVSLKNSLKKVSLIKEAASLLSSPLLKELVEDIDSVDEAAALIDGALTDPPPHSVKDGGVIKKGFSAELDGLRETGSGGKDWITSLEAQERKRTGIGSLKVGYNRVFGYYIEITKTHLKNVPLEYTRKQTLVNAERYITPELKEWEFKILTAEERSLKLEAELFEALVKGLTPFTGRIARTAELISVLDALLSFASAAARFGYVKPVVNGCDEIIIEDGRHPVVEANSDEGFIPNDIRLDNGSAQIVILTGPNMAGKSTYLRQNALIVFMAQTGSFVPASRAVLGVVDRIFTRVGASDDLARGQSTFMVEMNETANILNNVTPRSLVILDEVGRGTSTFDGLSIAWAVVEYLHDHPEASAKTLFATHYHELTELSLTKERVKNYNMAVREWNGEIKFLRKVVAGEASSSYGIHVAKLAGLPDGVLTRAAEILKNLEEGELTDRGVPRLAQGVSREAEIRQTNLLGKKDELREEIKSIDVERTTPMEALAILNKLKGLIDDRI
ncbi:MAG: DNA mismatch repair protein MutS [Thermodesulfobacteriota bacterium]|nr:MAG: DNA mismatch repair protein MutS [Thermodesulfobacteriota bacterium]